ncbi:MAG TPA: carboxymuconolactone decarboxylase family protein [Anaerolineales bacterium]|nr:carboxymuconolactone decarboxylase family protein [Anaerolineales bacterium]HRF47082.1 carboxymuconolactone decarboxylase family protein [Anaerolineales bacterium]
MEPRLDYGKTLPEGVRAINALDRYATTSGLEAPLRELIRLRASQINGCAYCVDMHTKDARTGGESEQRLYSLSVWRETPYYTDRERAALALTEAVTLISTERVSDAVYAEATRHFTDEELVKLLINISIINVWNRFAITFRDEPGSYEPEHFATKRQIIGA